MKNKLISFQAICILNYSFTYAIMPLGKKLEPVSGTQKNEPPKVVAILSGVLLL